MLNTNAVFTLGAFVRRDDYNYYPSGNPFADLGPPSLQRQTVAQSRSLTNAGVRSSLSYVKGIHNVKGGVTYEQTFLDENDTVGIVDPAYNAPCITFDVPSGTYVAAPGPRSHQSPQCNAALGYFPKHWRTLMHPANSTLYPLFNPVLATLRSDPRRRFSTTTRRKTPV